MYVCMLRVRLGLVLGRHPKINLFGLHYCVICCEVETKFCSLIMFVMISFLSVSLFVLARAVTRASRGASADSSKECFLFTFE